MNTTKHNNWPTISSVVKETLVGLGKVHDSKQTMREFDRLQFKKPKEYKSRDILKLRKDKMHMSQAVFAIVCNVKLPTLQKWEAGTRKPTPPVYRLFQIIEKNGLSVIEKAQKA